MNSTGRLICPECKKNGMGGYNYWESKLTYNNQELYIFYNKKSESKKWKCWALLGYCGCSIHQWWDPWGCFEKLCRGGEKIEEKMVRSRNDDEKEGCSAILCYYFLKLCLYIFILEIYFILYFFFCIWFDIYYAFCNKDKNRHVWNGNTELIINEKDDIWKNQEGYRYTEEYWVNNFSKSFKCDSCGYLANSFKKFIGNDTVTATINNNSTSMMNTTQISTQLGDSITVPFSVDNHEIKIQCNSHTLFSEVVNSLFEKIPEYKNKECLFFYKNDIMKLDQTIEKNGYKGGEIKIYVN